MIEARDIDAIEVRFEAWRKRHGDVILEQDVPMLIAEVRQLRAELSKMVQAHADVFNEWQKASGEAARATQVERQRWFDAAERVLASFYSRFLGGRDRDSANEVWRNIVMQAAP